MAPSFADIKAKAVKVKDVGIEKIQRTKSLHTSVPISKTNWNPYNGETAPPPPPRESPRESARAARPTMSFPAPPPAPNRPNNNNNHPPTPPTRTPSIVPRHSSSSSSSSTAAPPLPTRTLVPPPQLPARTPSINRSNRPDLGSGPIARTQSEPEIDWTNLSSEDKRVFFSWLDEFFSTFLNITIPEKKW